MAIARDIKNVQMPARDTILSTNEVMDNSPEYTPLLFDLTLTTEDCIFNTSNDLTYFEALLWKTLVIGGSQSNDRIKNHLQKIFNVSDKFMKYIREVPIKNTPYLCEAMLLSFAPSLKLQKDVVTYFRLHPNEHVDNSQMDLNARKTDLQLWQQYIEVIKDKNDRLSLTPLRLGLCDEFYALFQKYIVNDVYHVLLRQEHFSVKLRCPEEMVFSILVEEKPEKITALKQLKTRQILSCSDADFQRVMSKSN